MQTPNFYLFHILLTFDKQKIAFFWQTIHFCSMKWKVFIVVFVWPFLFLFQTEQFTWPYTHTQKMCSRFNSIRFAFFVVMHCLHLYLDCFIFIRAVLLQSCKKYSIPHSGAWRGVRVCLQRRAVTNVYICVCTDELAKNYLVCDVIGAFFQNSFRIVSISCIDFVIAFIESEKWANNSSICLISWLYAPLYIHDTHVCVRFWLIKLDWFDAAN